MGNSLSDLVVKANPDTVARMARNEEECFFGSSPTLSEINAVYSADTKRPYMLWLSPHLTKLSLFSGSKNIDIGQIEDLAETIYSEYFYLKITELMLFFHRFKSGHYGHFYGNVDPLVITTALREFIRERGEAIEEHDRELRRKEREQWAKNAVPMPESLKRYLEGRK